MVGKLALCYTLGLRVQRDGSHIFSQAGFESVYVGSHPAAARLHSGFEHDQRFISSKLRDHSPNETCRRNGACGDRAAGIDSLHGIIHLQ
jgi:hypothetical protein